MCNVPVFYATTEGHTRRIAEYLAHQMRQHGLDSQAIALTSPEAAHTEWDRVRGAVLAASIHIGKHQPEAVQFAHRHPRELSAVPSVFVSVSLAAASKNPAEVQAAHRLGDTFCAAAGWRPSEIASVAGCLAYTKYN
jgi:menaquinone-dependent protoporphyrinogen oxidase